MALSPKDAVANRKTLADEAVRRLEDFIDEQLVRYVHPTTDVCVSIPLDAEALKFISCDELIDRLSETYRQNGWNVSTEILTMYFSIAGKTAA